MERRPLGQTGIDLPLISFGASSLSKDFRIVDMDDALRSVRTALDLGMNFIDSSAYYGRGMSEVLVGIALRDVPRDQFTIGTKLGRYDLGHFDFSAKRVVESVDVSLYRLGVDHLDIILCHDIEFVDTRQIVEETVPALRKVQQAGKVRFVGISTYPMKVLADMLTKVDLDVVLSYNQYTLQNRRFAELFPMLKAGHVGIMNAAPFAARILTHGTIPQWHKASNAVKAACRKATTHCESRGADLAKLALQFSIRHDDITTTIVGSANPENVRKWARWIDEPIDQQLLGEVETILQPVMNESYLEGLAENN